MDILRLLLGLGLVQFGTCYPKFQQNIPNGEIVPSSCNPNHVWKGVGHKVKGGEGERNQFGIDFKANGYNWTDALCTADSDGDGRSNGEELGDPNCNWSKGATPETNLGLSHPGICEPIDSAMCQGKNDFLDCASDEFVCDALSDPDIVSRTVRLSNTNVPAKETTYMCQVLDILSDRDYHLVAAEPYIDNINVTHHILVYGCTDEAQITPDMRQANECFMSRREGCESLVAVWAVGSNGICYHEDVGFKVGLNGFKRVLIEMHWNNPMEEASYTDSSGMILHMTPNLRPNEAGMIMIGQETLVIPPGREKYSVNSSCSSDCTSKRLSDDIHLIGAVNHMHYLGSSAVTQMVSDKGEVTVIASDPDYNYDSPVFYIFEEAIKVEPGYELNLHCDFKSTSRSKTTFFGNRSSDEMCYAFLMYYPKNNWIGGDCVSTDTIDPCELEESVIKGCDVQQLLADQTDPENTARYAAVYENCRIGMCLEECKSVVREIFKHPCYQRPLHRLFQQEALETSDSDAKLSVMDFYYRLDSCAAELEKEQCKDGGNGNENGHEVGGSRGGHLTSIVFIVGTALFASLW